MTRLFAFLLGVVTLAIALPAGAVLRVVATTPDLASVARAIGQSNVSVSALALPTQDPHWVDAKPSLALELSRANLLLLTGADLEVGWLPTLQVGSRNADIQKGARGYLDCSELVDLLEVPAGKVDRSQGDLHPLGNPHYMLDPRAVERVAVGIGKRMAMLDPEHKQAYLDGTKGFLESLRAARAKWEKRLSRLRGTELVAYHKSLSYLASWLGFTVIEHLEPRPGIPPNPRHVAQVIEIARQHGVRLVLQESWFPSSTSRVLCDKTGAHLVILAGQPNFSAGESFVTFIENNVKRLERGLGG